MFLLSGSTYVLASVAQDDIRAPAEIISDYQHLLSPLSTVDSTPNWTYNIALHNDGPEDNAEWLQSFSINSSQEKLSATDMGFAYTTSQFKGQHDYSFYIQSNIKALETNNQDWQWQLNVLHQDYDASAFDEDVTYKNTITEVEAGITTNWYASNSYYFSFGVHLLNQRLDQNAEILSIITLNQTLIEQIIRNQNSSNPTLTELLSDIERLSNSAVAIIPLKSSHDFLLSSLTLSSHYFTDQLAATLSLNYKKNIQHYSNDEKIQFRRLGRLDTRTNYQRHHLNAAFTYQRNNTTRKRPTNTPHELTLSISGQFSFNDRLVPHAQFSLGGFNSVRGYDEHTASSDQGIYIQLEYHIKNYVFKSQTTASSLFFFIDVSTGKNIESNQSFPHASYDIKPIDSHDFAMLSTGVGLELTFNSGFTVLSNIGVVLKDLEYLDEQVIAYTRVNSLARLRPAGSQTTLILAPERTKLAKSGDTAIHFRLQYRF